MHGATNTCILVKSQSKPSAFKGSFMSFSNQDVQRIAKLARIRLNDTEASHYAQEISTILNWITQLQSVNTDGVAPLASVANQALPWREDVIRDGNIGAAIVQNAPDAQYGCFTVPKVIES
jgi:aspartyl-tRNA(Asn)/glutamyl-tRNA(Gln) amidotransferase subunit C